MFSSDCTKLVKW